MYFGAGPYDPSSDDIWDAFDILRNAKNQVFSKSVTEKARTSFVSSVGVIRERNEVFAIDPYVSMDDSEQEDELATPTQQIAKLIAVTWQHISIPLTYQAENVGERFKVLVESWQEQTRFMSSSTDIAMHPSYQQIIGLGKPALPADYGRASKERWPLVLGLESYFGNRSGATGRAGPIPENGREMAHMGSRRGTSLEGVGPGKRLSWFSRKHLSNHQPSVPHTIASLGRRVRQVFGGGRTPCRCTTGHPESPGENA